MKNWSIQEINGMLKLKEQEWPILKVHYANNEVFNPHPLTVKNQ